MHFSTPIPTLVSAALPAHDKEPSSVTTGVTGIHWLSRFAARPDSAHKQYDLYDEQVCCKFRQPADASDELGKEVAATLRRTAML